MSLSFTLFTSLSCLNNSVCIMFCVHVLPPQSVVAVAGVTAVAKLKLKQSQNWNLKNTFTLVDSGLSQQQRTTALNMPGSLCFIKKMPYCNKQFMNTRISLRNNFKKTWFSTRLFLGTFQVQFSVWNRGTLTCSTHLWRIFSFWVEKK